MTPDEREAGDGTEGDGERGSASDGEGETATDDEQRDADPEHLAAVVDKGRGDATLAALREEGVYDDDRRIVEHGDGTLAIPVTDPPETAVLEVIRQHDPERRTRDLGDLLRERGWTDDELAGAPASWAVVGSVVLVDLPGNCHDEVVVGEALLELHRNADTVLAREGIDGPTREPERRVIAGLGDTETVHDEHGVRYALDLAEVMFSPGNKAERARMAALVAAGRDSEVPVATVEDDAIPDRVPDLDPSPDAPLSETDADPERVFDMFAGAGYFTLPAAIAGARVDAAEIDAGTFGYLVENARLNGVGDRIAPYLADCRDLADVVDADRVIMGHWDADEYLDVAMAAVRPGGVVHYHAVVPEPELPDRPIERVEDAAAAAGRSADIVDVRRVKSYGEGVWHVVADARIDG